MLAKTIHKIESIIDIASIVHDLPHGRRFLFRGQNVNEPPLLVSRERFGRGIFLRKKSLRLSAGCSTGLRKRVFLFSKTFGLTPISTGYLSHNIMVYQLDFWSGREMLWRPFGSPWPRIQGRE